jgi:hypothetical protein
MILYNDTILDFAPTSVPFTKRIAVEKEDVFFSFIQCDIHKNTLDFVFSIGYYNMPIDEKTYLFEKMIDLQTVRKVLNTIIKKESTLSIKSLKCREAIISFDIDSWLSKNIFPIEVSRKRINSSYVFKSKNKLPKIVEKNIAPDISRAICDRMIYMLKENKRAKLDFKKKFSTDLVVSSDNFFDSIGCSYLLKENSFEVTLRSDIIRMMYLTTKTI